VKKLAIPVTLTLLLACASLLPAVQASAAQDEFIRKFQTWSKGALKIVTDKNTGAPVFVAGTLSARQTGTPEAGALRFLEENKSFFKMKNPLNDLKPLAQAKDELGMTHIRFQQTKQGLPVDGRVVIVHLDAGHAVQGVNGSYDATLDAQDLDATPGISAETAVRAAKKALSAPDALAAPPHSELVWYSDKGKQQLAYKVNLAFVKKAPEDWFLFVDAKTGEVFDRYNAALEADYHPAQGVGIGYKGDWKPVRSTFRKPTPAEPSPLYFLQDTRRSNMAGIFTHDAAHSWDLNALPFGVATDGDNVWQDPNQASAVDAHSYVARTYDYFLNAHGRNSIDGNGMAIHATVHFGEGMNDAFWFRNQIVFGDGDGFLFKPYSTGLDVTAHEITHGVTQFTSGLRFRHEQGALNESYSDVFAALIDGNWELGEDILAEGAVQLGYSSVRSMSDPSKYPVATELIPYGDGSGLYPEHMSQYYHAPEELDGGGVHFNSAIPNHAAYKIATAIGRDKMGRIYYRALTVYLTPTSTFRDQRIATIQSARDLYGAGSAEEQAVVQAFDQVGIVE